MLIVAMQHLYEWPVNALSVPQTPRQCKGKLFICLFIYLTRTKSVQFSQIAP